MSRGATLATNSSPPATDRASGVLSTAAAGLTLTAYVVIVGLVAAFVLAKIRRLIDDPVLDTTLSFAAPWWKRSARTAST